MLRLWTLHTSPGRWTHHCLYDEARSVCRGGFQSWCDGDNAEPTPTTAAAETGLEAPNDLYVEKSYYGNDWHAHLPSGVSESDMVKHLNEIQHAKETSEASWLQRVTGTVARQPAQKLSSCDNVATSSNCGSEGRPIDYVTSLADGRLLTNTDFEQIDALLPRIKQFTFVRSVPGQTCEDWAQSTGQQTMEFMAEKYPGVPMRQVCAWDGEIQSGAVEL